MKNGLQELLKVLAKSKASDLHIGAGMIPSFRLHGSIVPLSKEAKPLEANTVQTMIFQVLSQDLQGKLHEDGELDFSMGIPGVGRFRCNIHRQRGTYAAVFRKIPSMIPTFEQLGLPQVVRDMSQKESGLVLVTGPSGSGKSMTMATIIETINTTRQSHIITVEDPIEFVFSNKKSIVKQREVGSDTPTYRSALKHIFRQDPDVIMIGEMRDPETIAVALTSAATGRLVLGTLHTVDAISTVTRIIESFPPDQQTVAASQLAGCLEGVVSQQLLLRKDGKGRVLATETMVSTPSVRNLIRSEKYVQIQNDMEVGRRFGMQTMNQNLHGLVISEAVKLEEALRHTRSPDALMRAVGVPK